MEKVSVYVYKMDIVACPPVRVLYRSAKSYIKFYIVYTNLCNLK